jgi:hypothetical protein
MDDFRKATLLPDRRAPAPPPGCGKLPRDRWLDIQDDEFRLAQPGKWAAITPDPLASDGVAARMPGDHHEWAVSVPLDFAELAKRPKQTWRISVAVRVERAGNDGVAFTCGMYDTEEKKGYGHRTVKLADVKSDDYAIYELGTFPVNARRYLWVAPAKNGANVKAVWVDRLILVAERLKP